MLKWLLTITALLAATFVIATFFVPTQWQTHNEIEIQADRETIHAFVGSLETWIDWTVWNKETDPDCEWTYEGSGTGASMRWDGPKHGKGKLTVSESNRSSGLRYTVAIAGMGSLEGRVSYADGKTAGSTRVEWTDSGTSDGFLERWLALVIAPLIEATFQTNLANLKAHAEQAALASGGDSGRKPSDNTGR